MSTLSESHVIALDGIAASASASTSLDAVGTHPMVVDALGQESVDQLMASVQGVVRGAAAAAEALNASIKFDSIAAKADSLMAAHGDATEAAGSDVPETVDVAKLRDATGKFREVVQQAHGLADTLEQLLSDEAVVSRLRHEFATNDDSVDLEVVKGALASLHPGNVAIAGVVGAAINHVTEAGKEAPADVQEAIAHLEESLADSLQDLSKLIERLRDLAIAAVDRLS